MAVEIAFTSEQSTLGTTITFTDTSVYTAPDVIGDYTRSFVLKDSAGADLDTIEIPTGELTVDYAVTRDIWIDTTLNAVGSTTYSDTLGFYFFRNTANKLIEANAEGCCTSKSAKENLVEALRFIKGAEYAAPIGNKTAYQANINSANAYLDQVV